MHARFQDLHSRIFEFETLVPSRRRSAGFTCPPVITGAAAGTGPAVVEDAGAGAVDVETGFGCCGLRGEGFAVAGGLARGAGLAVRGDDNVGFSVHEAACFEGFDVQRKDWGGRVFFDGREDLGRWGGLQKGVSVYVVRSGVGRAVDGEEVVQSLWGVGWWFVHCGWME